GHHVPRGVQRRHRDAARRAGDRRRREADDREAGRSGGAARPDVADGGGAGALAGIWQAVHVLKGAQHVEVVDVPAVLPRLDPLVIEDRGYLVVLAAVVLVPGDDQEAVVRLGPLGVGIDVVLQPGIALLDRTVVHVVLDVRDDEGDGRQLGVVRWPVAGVGHV